MTKTNIQKTNIQKSFLLTFLSLCLLLGAAGCAKSPSSGITSPASGPQLLISLSVAGNINPNYYYFVVFNVNNTTNPNTSGTGPVPVFAPPYGNGFAAGAFTNYVEYHQGQISGSSFGFYAVGANLLATQNLPPGDLVNTQVGASTISFQLPLAFLATPTVPVGSITSVQVNFIATNVTPPPGDTLTQKYVGGLFPSDASGNLNQFVSIQTSQNGTFNNSQPTPIPLGGVVQYVNGIPAPVSTSQFPDVAELSLTNFSITLSGAGQ